MGRKKKEETIIISFRLTKEAADKLAVFARKASEPLEPELNMHTAARKLVLNALKGGKLK